MTPMFPLWSPADAECSRLPPPVSTSPRSAVLTNSFRGTGQRLDRGRALPPCRVIEPDRPRPTGGARVRLPWHNLAAATVAAASAPSLHWTQGGARCSAGGPLQIVISEYSRNSGETGVLSARRGQYRVIYSVHEDQLLVRVVGSSRRADVYG